MPGKSKTNQAVYLFALAVSLLFPACAARTDYPGQQVPDPLSVSPEQIVIVGKIEIHPPLQPGEQVLRVKPEIELKDMFMLYGGRELLDLAVATPDDFKGSFAVKLEQDFFIKIERGNRFYLSGGLFYTLFDAPSRIETQVYSSPFLVELRPEDTAVYIGTIQYYRERVGNNTLRSVMVRDDFQWAESQFKDRFGAGKKLRKVLVVPVR